jgi:hypothetical protein
VCRPGTEKLTDLAAEDPVATPTRTGLVPMMSRADPDRTTRRARSACAIAAVFVASALAAGLLAAPVSAQRNAVEATIHGQVLNEATGLPLAGVRIELLDVRDRIRARTETDAEGQFVLARLTAGPFWLRASRAGYARTRTPGWRIESGEVLSVTIRMDAEVVLLAPLEVTARIRTHSPVLAGFQTRLQRRMGGTLFSRDDIEQRNPSTITDLLLGVPGLDVQSVAGMSARIVTMSRALPGVGSGTAKCPVQYYVDGVLASRGGQEVSPDELAVPMALEGIEVYRGLGTIPAEFLTPEARCGVIAIWTRRGG